MRHQRLTKSLRTCRVRDEVTVVPDGAIEKIQMKRLAGAVLSKQPEDLAALFECNPALMREWIDAFRREKLAAEAEARYWSAAMAALSTSAPRARLTAAE
jgi:transposase-like protein